MHILKDKILNLFFPPVCGFCNEINEDFLCDKCRRRIESIKISNIDSYINKSVYFDESCYIFKYEKDIRDMIIKYKFEERSYLYKTFSRVICEDVIFSDFVKKYDCIISVPIHKKRMKLRGYNQSKLVAEDVAKYFGIMYYDNVLEKNKNIVPQSSLDKLNRINNVRGAFNIIDCSKIVGKNVIIFDDVFTTGATSNECAKVLKEAGAENVGVFSIAKD